MVWTQFFFKLDQLQIFGSKSGENTVKHGITVWLTCLTWDVVFNPGHHFKIQPKPRSPAMTHWGWYLSPCPRKPWNSEPFQTTLDMKTIYLSEWSLLVFIPKLDLHIEPNKSSWRCRHLCSTWWHKIVVPKVILHSFFHRIYFSNHPLWSILIVHHFKPYPSWYSVRFYQRKIASGHCAWPFVGLPSSEGCPQWPCRLCLSCHGGLFQAATDSAKWSTDLPVLANLEESSNHPKWVSEIKEVWKTRQFFQEPARDSCFFPTFKAS